MADSSSFISCSNISSRQKKYFPLEPRPRMLKDFLLDDSKSCSLNGFKSFPRKPCQVSTSSIRNLIQVYLNSSHAKPNYRQRLQRSRSKAASTTISALQAMINAVKNIHLVTSLKVKPPSILPRSLSRKLSKHNSRKDNEIEMTVRVKDIIRWKSIRDLVEEKSPPSDFASSPLHCSTTTVTTTTTGSTCTPCSSKGSSWCDSDFTSEYLQSEDPGENEVDDVVEGKKFLPCVGKDSTETTTQDATNTSVGPKGKKYASGEKEQNSPFSVLDFDYEEDDEEPLSSFSRCLASMERKRQKLMQNIQRFESLAKMEPVDLGKWMSMEETEEEDGDEDDYVEEEEETNEVEEKAWQLLNHVKETSSLKRRRNISTDKLLLDLFKEELATKWNQTRKQELEDDMVRQATAWINREGSETAKWGVGEKREAYVRDMDREGKWSKFEEEQEELALEVESRVMSILVDEILIDLL